MSWSLAAEGVLSLGIAVLAYVELRRYLFEQCAVRLRAQAKPIIDRRIEHLLGQVPLPELAAILAMDLTNRDTTAILVDPTGEVVAAGSPDHGPIPSVLGPDRYRATFDGATDVTYVMRKPGEGRQLAALIPPRGWLPDTPAIVQLTTYLEREEKLLRRFGVVVGVGVAAVIAASVVLRVLLGEPQELLALGLIPLLVLFARIRWGHTYVEPLEDELVGYTPDEGPRTEFTATMRRVEAAFLAKEAQEERVRRFLTESSHELRTPLSSLGAAADVLLGGAKSDPDHVERMARVIRNQADRMWRLVEDLLTLARLDSGLPLRRELVSLADLATQGAEELSLSAPDRKVDLRCRAAAFVSGDRDRLTQILANLTSNAARHTYPAGRIGIEVGVDDPWAILTVTDDGDGIAADDLPRIFERFYRADRGRSSDGFGLGLAIVREIVEAHGGTVGVHSAHGQGTTFSVRLPLSVAPTTGPRNAGDGRPSRPRSMPA